MFATWCSRIPDIKTKLLLNDAQLGTLLLLLPVGQFLCIMPNGLLVKRLGSRTALILAGFLYPSILLLIGFTTTFWGLATLLFLAGAAANLSNTAANTQGVLLEQRYERSIMALFHGMWSAAGLIAVGIAILLTNFQISLTHHFLLMSLGAALLLSFSGGALAEDPPTPSSTSLSQSSLLAEWKFTSVILWLGIACFGCMACEGTVYDWSSVYFKDVLQVESSQQRIGYFAYLCTMVTGRFVIDKIVNRLGIYRVLITCAIAITVGFIIAITGAMLTIYSLPIVIVGFALIGCGTSAVVPLCCSLAGTCKELSPGIAIAEISTIGFFGFLITPPLIGYLSDAIGLQYAFIVMAVISLPILLAILKLKRYNHA